VPTNERDGRYGPRLDLAEYERRLIGLHGAAAAKPSSRKRWQLDRAELELRIDYRLGLAFPAGRRDELWRAQTRVRARWWLLVVQNLASGLSRRLGVTEPPGGRFVQKEFATVLDPDDLEAFLGDGMRDGGLRT
jgi:hypothetical protein